MQKKKKKIALIIYCKFSIKKFKYTDIIYLKIES